MMFYTPLILFCFFYIQWVSTVWERVNRHLFLLAPNSCFFIFISIWSWIFAFLESFFHVQTRSPAACFLWFWLSLCLNQNILNQSCWCGCFMIWPYKNPSSRFRRTTPARRNPEPSLGKNICHRQTLCPGSHFASFVLLNASRKVVSQLHAHKSFKM